jgi:hypothetical protein
MSTAVEWAKGYARQAKADFDTWNQLQGNDSVPKCHKLLFLQMACEKLAKSHLCTRGSNPADLQTSHAYIAKNLPIIIRQQIPAANSRRSQNIFRHIKHLAREIELLSPAVTRDGQRPDNCEYPWEDGGGSLHVPLDWSFVPSELLNTPAGPALLKHIYTAIGELLQ